MQIAILIVYLFDRATKPMVEIHLDEIRKNTPQPYRIYASTALLGEEERAFLAAQPDIVTVATPPAPEGATHGEEHAHHLEALRQVARGDTPTHYATLHPDSFPIRPDWVARIAAELDRGAEFAIATPAAFTGCMMWPAAYEARDVPLRLAPEAWETPDYAAFRAAVELDDYEDTGHGFLFDAWSRGARWHGLAQGADPVLWGDAVVHLVHVGKLVVNRGATTAKREGAIRGALALLRPVWRRLPAWVHGRTHAILQPVRSVSKADQVRALIADPDAFLAPARAAAQRS